MNIDGKDITKEEQYNVLLQFFYECVRFWEHELKVTSDESKEPYIHALKEVPRNHPKYIKGYEFDSDVRENFIKDRYMDTYGKEWKRYYEQRKSN